MASRTRSEIDRRTFLRRAGATVIVGSLGSVIVDSFSPLGMAAYAADAPPLPPGTPILVHIDLQGGNDGLNTFIPVEDAWYYDATYGHGPVAIAHNNALPVSGVSNRLHPNLTWLADRWNTVGDVAVVEGVGENVLNDFSHFAASYYRNVAGFTPGIATGWLGRYNDARAAGSPFASVSTSGLHPMLLGTRTPVLSVRDAGSFRFDVDWRWDFSGAFANAARAMGTPRGALGAETSAAVALANTFDAVDRVSAAYQSSYLDGIDGNWLAYQLSQAAMLIAAGVPSQTYVAQAGGFDTHGNQERDQGALLASLDAALAHFFGLVGATSRAGDVFVVLTTEFGRKITHNASRGLDHGQASLAVVVGGGVQGGQYGEAPTLDPGGDTRPNRIDDALVPTVDFRSLYATVLNRLGGDANLSADVLDGTFEDLGIFG